MIGQPQRIGNTSTYLPLKDEKLLDKLEDGAMYGLWRRALELKQSVYLPNPLDWGRSLKSQYLLFTLTMLNTHVHICM